MRTPSRFLDEKETAARQRHTHLCGSPCANVGND